MAVLKSLAGEPAWGAVGTDGSWQDTCPHPVGPAAPSWHGANLLTNTEGLGLVAARVLGTIWGLPSRLEMHDGVGSQECE